MIRRPQRSTRVRSSAASDVYKRQIKPFFHEIGGIIFFSLCCILLSLIHISEPTRLLSISYAVFCLKKKKKFIFFFFFNDTATTEIYTRKIVGSVRCV